MKKLGLVPFLDTAGGRIRCKRCQAKARSGRQCAKPAIRGKRVCRNHGGASTGPQTEAGRLRIAQAKTQHGNETRQARAERSAMSAKILAVEEILYVINAATGPRTSGRKPATYTPITTVEDAIAYMAAHLITS